MAPHTAFDAAIFSSKIDIVTIAYNTTYKDTINFFVTNSFMNDLTLISKREFKMDGYPQFKCNICGNRADFVVQLELFKQKSRYDALHSQQMPFYLCKGHEYVYKKMQQNIDLKDYFPETIKENQ